MVSEWGPIHVIQQGDEEFLAVGLFSKLKLLRKSYPL